jgi:protease IV
MTFTRESIFFSALRSLCNALGVVLGVFIAFFAILITVSVLSGPESLPAKSEITIAPDANGIRDLLPNTSPAILRINIEGVIGLDKLTGEKFQEILYDSREGPLEKNRVKAVLLYVNTPGGGVTDTEVMYKALMEYKKKHNVPVYAFVEGMCASGGMYLCSAADKIYASPSSIIGSVGVRLGPTFNFSELMTKAGVQSKTLTAGKDKDTLNPFRPWTEDEGADLDDIILGMYNQFVNVVVEGRPNLDREKLVQDYGARVFIAKTAEKFGYIDNSNATYSEAMKDLAETASLDKAYQVVELSRPEGLFSQLTQNSCNLLSGKVEHVFSAGPYNDPKLSGKLLYLYQP